MISQQLLRSVSVSRIPVKDEGKWPFSVPLIANRPTLEFKTPVTFLVGENGSGKSTLLEAIAVASQARTIGSVSAEKDPTLNDVRKLAHSMKLIWSVRNKEGFFLRAEDFFGFVKYLQQTKAGLLADIEQIKKEYVDRSDYALGLALLPYRNELNQLQKHYGDGLDTMSHGESFLKLFQARFVPKGLYILDEPETPLSPLRQLSLLSQIKVMVEEKCQFIIATHSPILMAYPGATILSLTANSIESVDYDSLEHVTLTRDFLISPETFLRYL